MVLLRPDSASRTAGSAATSTALMWLMVWVRALTAEALGQLEHSKHLPWPLTGLRVAPRPATEHCPSSGLGVEDVGRAPPRPVALSGWLTSITSIPAAGRYRASAAPEEPVHST